MSTLNIEIQKKMSPVPTNLPSIEASIAILDNLKSNIDEKSYEFLEWEVHYIRSLTKKAIFHQQLETVWSSEKVKEDDNEEEKTEHAAESLEQI